MLKISIFVQNFDFWPKFLFLSKISIFVQNFNFCLKFRFLSKISIFVQNFDVSSKFQFFVQNFHSCFKKKPRKSYFMRHTVFLIPILNSGFANIGKGWINIFVHWIGSIESIFFTKADGGRRTRFTPKRFKVYFYLKTIFLLICITSYSFFSLFDFAETFNDRYFVRFSVFLIIINNSN